MNYLQKFYDQAFHWLITFGPRLIIAIVVMIVGQLEVALPRGVARLAVGRAQRNTMTDANLKSSKMGCRRAEHGGDTKDCGDAMGEKSHGCLHTDGSWCFQSIE